MHTTYFVSTIFYFPYRSFFVSSNGLALSVALYYTLYSVKMGNCSAAPVEPTTAPSTVRTARTVDTTNRTAPLKREPSKFQLVHSTSLRDTLSPPKSPSTQVARFTIANLFILEDQFTLLQ